ncbi:hypothetical protein MA6G0728R_4782 [Mycobacteroides abscessus 6G-0728-R]|nr:hypothetical protein MA6G0125S_4852 [Mycobacteroides abscessus 6G-0125-S]EIU52309.1 hypothetical protein MA6G1108_4781 [Mycobacteroides abscessus 6G-1108]EIU95966.1 hypothetical protein MA6G0728R_4782 [Mycobacteroides abscessus 6G-0728-R]
MRRIRRIIASRNGRMAESVSTSTVRAGYSGSACLSWAVTTTP